jgi:hypothetical protein
MNDQVIIELAVKRLVSEFGSELLRVLAGGSRLRSEGDAHSDLDIVAVVDRPCRKRWNFLIDGNAAACSSTARGELGSHVRSRAWGKFGRVSAKGSYASRRAL